ncbi:predicted protein [Postia placenta Mad-698-R]|nr:predicted protein [Postia placenta Mad-698-R]
MEYQKGPQVRSSKGSSIVVEVCIDSVESAIAFVDFSALRHPASRWLFSSAANGGADRLEICGNLGLGGGTTPTLALFRAVKRAVPGIPIMVNPSTPHEHCARTANPELDIMLEDIRILKQAGADGLVFGVLSAEGFVDTDRTTSGHKPAAPSALPALRDLLQKAAEPTHPTPASTPAILVGSGINPATVRPVLDALLPHGLREIHLSGGSWVPGEMQYRPPGMGMGVGGDGEWGIWRTSEERVREVRRIADLAWEEYINIEPGETL